VVLQKEGDSHESKEQDHACGSVGNGGSAETARDFIRKREAAQHDSGNFPVHFATRRAFHSGLQAYDLHGDVDHVRYLEKEASKQGKEEENLSRKEGREEREVKEHTTSSTPTAACKMDEL
jgi:hypothetical protein